MMAIKAAIAARGEGETRNVVLVPDSAHGTNPATAALIGFSVRPVPAGADGIVSVEAVRERARARRRGDHADQSQYLRTVRARDRRRSPRRCTRPAPISTATARISTPSSARRGPATSASTRCTSICTRPFRRRMAAAARARDRSCCPIALAPFAPVPYRRARRRCAQPRRTCGRVGSRSAA